MTNANATLPAIASLTAEPLCERALALENFVHSLVFGRHMKKYRNALEATTLQLSRIAGRATIVDKPSRKGQLLDQIVERLGDLRMTFQSFRDVDGIGDRELEQATTLLVALESVVDALLVAVDTPGQMTTTANLASAPDTAVDTASSVDQMASGSPLVDRVSNDRTEDIAAMTSVSLDIERTARKKRKASVSSNPERRQSRGAG